MYLRTLIQRNFWLKCFALVSAMLLWLFIKYGGSGVFLSRQLFLTSPPVEEVITLPVKVLGSPGDNRRYDVLPAQAQVKVRGEADLVHQRSADIVVYVDPTSPDRGKLKIHAPPMITVLECFPLAVKVEPRP